MSGYGEPYEDDQWNEEYDDYEYDDPIGSCHECGMDIYEDEDDGSGLCGQCQWYFEQGHTNLPKEPAT